MTVKKLVLWDIDHTLIETGGVGSEVFHDAFEQVTGHKIDKLADVTGRTEPVIFRETLEMYGIEDPGDYFSEFVKTQAQGYRARAGEMRRRGRVLPGARESLIALAGLPGIKQSVLTGNPQPSAQVKLNTFGLVNLLDLDCGAYGTDDSIRANLVGIAQRRLRKRYGVRIPMEDMVVIGDTTGDVDAALESGAQIIAVASGDTGEDQLRAAGATIVLESLSKTDEILRAIILDSKS